MYNIGEFAKLINKSVITLQRWDRDQVLVAKRTKTNRRYYTEDQLLECKGLKATSNNGKTIAYCRVSSKNQVDDLKSQKEYINQFCLNGSIGIDDWIEDIGSGLNYNRSGFNQLLKEVECGTIKKIIIAHKDRLIRFGYEWFDNFCTNHGCEIVVINNEKLSPQEELVNDLINIIDSFTVRIPNLLKYKKQIQADKELA